MLIWINGPFGGGKTQTAYELHRRTQRSVICDPEIVGFGLHRMTPRPLRGDFQDHPAWRQGVFEVLDLVLTKFDGTVIAPMTLVEPTYFDEVVGRLREKGHDVRHFALLADRETVLKRLRGRSIVHAVRPRGAPRKEWFAVAKLDRCLEQLRRPEFAEQIRTDNLSIAEVADHIAAASGLTLTPNPDNRIVGYLRRSWTSAQHIRFR
jgi:hypothetical protein